MSKLSEKLKVLREGAESTTVTKWLHDLEEELMDFDQAVKGAAVSRGAAPLSRKAQEAVKIYAEEVMNGGKKLQEVIGREASVRIWTRGKVR